MGDPLGGVVHDAASFAAARSRREAGTRWSGGRAAAIGWRKSATPPALRLVVPDQLSGLERVVEIGDGNQPLPRRSASRGACPRNTWGLDVDGGGRGAAGHPVRWPVRAWGESRQRGPEPNDTQPRCCL